MIHRNKCLTVWLLESQKINIINFHLTGLGPHETTSPFPKNIYHIVIEKTISYPICDSPIMLSLWSNRLFHIHRIMNNGRNRLRRIPRPSMEPVLVSRSRHSSFRPFMWKTFKLQFVRYKFVLCQLAVIRSQRLAWLFES